MNTALEQKSIAEELKRLNITVESTFIPFSQSRNSKEKHRSMNWRVVLKYQGKPVTISDYSEGIGHVPFYSPDKSNDMLNYLYRASEEGKVVDPNVSPATAKRIIYGSGMVVGTHKASPDIENVVYSLLTDSEVLDYRSFEDWAKCIGYETDSRAAEKIYKQCLEIGLALRNAVGEKVLAELRKLFEDY